MGNVFCQFFGEALPPPIFHLGVENGVIKDVAGSVNIVNHNVVVTNDAQEGECMSFAGGFINTNFLDEYGKLYKSGNFSIRFKIKVLSIVENVVILGSFNRDLPLRRGLLYGFENPNYIRFYINENIKIRGVFIPNVWTDITISSSGGIVGIYWNNTLLEQSRIVSDIPAWPLLIGGYSLFNGRMESSNMNALVSYLKIYDKPIK